MLNIFLEWLIQPMSIFLVSLATASIISLSSRWTRQFKIGFLSVTICLLLLFSSPMFANFLVRQLENARLNPHWCKAGQTSLPIVVLGGGKSDYINSASVYDILETASIRRAALAVHVANDATQFYLLGGGHGRYKESDLMADILRDMGVNEAKIFRESSSMSTRQNAEELARLFEQAQSGEALEAVSSNRIALVTSSMHVPRASKIFESEGFEVCHYAADVRYAKAVFPVSVMPYVGALKKTTDAFHEYLGYFVFWLGKELTATISSLSSS